MALNNIPVPKATPSVGSNNNGGGIVCNYKAMDCSERYMAVWRTGITEPRCMRTETILRDDEIEFNCVKNVHFMKYKPCKEWIEALTIV